MVCGHRFGRCSVTGSFRKRRLAGASTSTSVVTVAVILSDLTIKVAAAILITPVPGASLGTNSTRSSDLWMAVGQGQATFLVFQIRPLHRPELLQGLRSPERHKRAFSRIRAALGYALLGSFPTYPLCRFASTPTDRAIGTEGTPSKVTGLQHGTLVARCVVNALSRAVRSVTNGPLLRPDDCATFWSGRAGLTDHVS
jgi:hypothetical protein